MPDHRFRPLWIDLAVAALAPFFFVLPGRHAGLPDDRRKSVRWALAVGTVAWLALLWWAVS